MTEVQWLECTDPEEMLESLRGKISERKLRLFACACVRKVWPFLTKEQSRNAIIVAERHANGTASDEQLEAAYQEAYKAAVLSEESHNESVDENADEEWNEVSTGLHTQSASFFRTKDSNAYASAMVAHIQVGDSISSVLDIDSETQPTHLSLLLDVVGNTFRSASLNHACRTITVMALARTAYDERSFPSEVLDSNRLAVLADALEDAGCTDPEILSYLRGPGPHVQGCWVLDLLLGKK